MHTTLDLARLAHRDRLSQAETDRAARAVSDRRRAERLEARAARLRERAAGGAVWAGAPRALPRPL